LLPVVILPVILLTLGVTWVFSSLGVFLRDCGQLVGLGTTGLLFLSPIFYPASIVPERYRDLYFANPLAGVLEMSKLSLFEGGVPDPVEWLLLFGVSWAVAWAGHSWFIGTKSSFADVL
jgi:lipopolysaccharide transport system permease protein